MDDFSWADSIRATIGSCLPCVAPNADSDDERNGQNRAVGVGRNSAREELERLLDEPITDHEDVETMSLHSNVGHRAGKSRGKKATPRKSVRVFGIDLFGRRPAPPAEEDDDDENHNDDRVRRPRTRPRAISTSNLDEDAAPLDDALFDVRTRAQERWAPSRTDEELAAEEALERQRAEKQLRKAERRQRKELKRLAEAGAFNGTGADEFEGFPGSGGGGASVNNANATDEFGPFVGVTSPPETAPGLVSEDKDDEDVDFGAAAYTKKRRVVDGEGSRSGSGSHSRSRSRASTSISADGSQPRMRPTTNVTNGQLQTPTRPTHKTAKAASARRSKSSVTSSSATTSLPSPTLQPSSHVRINTQDFEGVPGGLLTDGDRIGVINKSNFPSPSLSSAGFPSAGFPSTGFSNFKRAPSGLSGGAGVALARRGDE